MISPVTHRASGLIGSSLPQDAAVHKAYKGEDHHGLKQSR
jgi:hypothetical protein